MDTDIHNILRYILQTRYDLRCLQEYEKADKLLGELLEKYEILDVPAYQLEDDKVTYYFGKPSRRSHEFVWDEDSGTIAIEREYLDGRIQIS